jgi:hypothetical protein
MERKSRISPTFFLDRTHGKRTSRLLASVGMTVILHDRWFQRETRDPVWIARCGQEQWIVLSGDKSIETVPENRQAVIDAKCKILFFNDSSSYPEEWAAAVIVGRDKLLEIIERNDGPFFLTIDKHSRTHISAIRFVGSGGPKPAAGNQESGPATPGPPLTSLPPRTPQQGELFTKKQQT